jgi:hypothetical protein
MEYSIVGHSDRLLTYPKKFDMPENFAETNALAYLKAE